MFSHHLDGLDYDVVYLNRTLNESQSVSCFDVTMLDDTCLEPSQNFSLHLSSYEDAVMVEDHQSTTVTILEDSLDCEYHTCSGCC